VEVLLVADCDEVLETAARGIKVEELALGDLGTVFKSGAMRHELLLSCGYWKEVCCVVVLKAREVAGCKAITEWSFRLERTGVN
jgi:hypothetical protein